MAPRPADGQIVVGVDGSPGSVAALRWAIDEGRRRGDALTVVRTWTDPLPLGGPGLPVGAGATMRRETKRSIEEVVARAGGDGVAGVEIRPTVIAGRAAEALCQISEDADLLVVGSRGLGGLTGMLLGSVSQQCVLHARCPVVIVPDRGPVARTGEGAGTSRIVVGIDGSAGSYLAMEWAMSEAQLRGSVLDLVHVWRLPAPVLAEVDDDLRDASAEVLAEAHKEAASMDGSVRIETNLMEGRTASRLLEASEWADLVVVGSRGHGGFAGLLLGSVSQACAAQAPCPVAVIRGAEV